MMVAGTDLQLMVSCGAYRMRMVHRLIVSPILHHHQSHGCIPCALSFHAVRLNACYRVEYGQGNIVTAKRKTHNAVVSWPLTGDGLSDTHQAKFTLKRYKTPQHCGCSLAWCISPVVTLTIELYHIFNDMQAIP